MSTAPAGFDVVRAFGAQAWIRPRAGWLREAVEEGRSLHGAALRAGPVEMLEGRGVVPVVRADAGGASPGRAEGDGERWAVRHYERGGAVASLLGDRYLRLGAPRPLRELRASEEVRARGIPTPEVVAAAVYPAGPFYRGDLVTVYVPHSADLAAVLFGGGLATDPDEAAALRSHALVQAGRLVERMAAAGVHHPDLNAKNLLFSRGAAGESGSGTVEVHLLDLDRCGVGEGPVDPGPMRRRLRRSLEKLGLASGRPLGRPELELLDPAPGAPGRAG